MLLVVDDGPAMLETASLLPESSGHQVTTARSGGEALALLADARFDAVLTDLSMPEMNGLQLVQRIRLAGLTLPCLLVTGWGSDLPAGTIAAEGRGCCERSEPG